MLSHQLKQFKIDGEKTIIQNPNEAQRKEHEKCEFELHEVYAIDVLVSSGEGIVRLPKKICSCRWISKFSFIFFSGSRKGHESFDLQENGGELSTEIEGVTSAVD